MATGILDEKSAARQLLGAGALDLVAVYIAAVSLLPLLRADLPFLRMAYGLPLVWVVLLAAFWALTDVIFAGYTPGRLAFGLTMVDDNGHLPSFSHRMMRVGAKLPTLGLAGLRWDRAARYDRFAGISWASAMSPVRPGASASWRLSFVAGPHAGSSVPLGQPGKTGRSREIRIGRDRDWANLAVEDSAISNRQCRLRISGNRIEVMDGGGGRTGSTNGTYLGERRLAPGKWEACGPGDTLRFGRSAAQIATR